MTNTPDNTELFWVEHVVIVHVTDNGNVLMDPHIIRGEN